ncbi:hypothetical protein D3C86_1800590 [compost metagenome]
MARYVTPFIALFLMVKGSRNATWPLLTMGPASKPSTVSPTRASAPLALSKPSASTSAAPIPACRPAMIHLPVSGCTSPARRSVALW